MLAWQAEGSWATYTDRPVNNFNTADIRARLFTADGLPGNFLEIAVDPGATFWLRCRGHVGRRRVCGGDLDAPPGPRSRCPDERSQRRRQRPRRGGDAVNVNLAHNAFGGTVAGLAGGGFVVAWEQSNEVRYRRFDANGNALDGTDAIGTLIDASGGIKTDVRVAGLPDGGFVVAYQDGNWGTQLGITAVVFNPDGTHGSFLHVAIFARRRRRLGVAGVQLSPNSTGRSRRSPDGGFVVTYTNGGVLYGRVYQASGTARTGNIVIDAAGDNSRSKVVGLPNGNWAVAYRDTGWLDADAGNAGITMVIYKPNGDLATPDPIHVNTPGAPPNPIRTSRHFPTASSSSPGRIRFR